MACVLAPQPPDSKRVRGHAAETWPRRHAASVTSARRSGPTPPTAGPGRPCRRPEAARARRNPVPPGRIGPDRPANVSRLAGRDEKVPCSRRFRRQRRDARRSRTLGRSNEKVFGLVFKSTGATQNKPGIYGILFLIYPWFLLFFFYGQRQGQHTANGDRHATALPEPDRTTRPDAAPRSPRSSPHFKRPQTGR